MNRPLLGRLLRKPPVIPTDCASLDDMLDGGLPLGCITLVYGEAETGKTTLATQCSVSCARMGLKALYLNFEGGFTVDRLAQMAPFDWEDVAPKILVFSAEDFQAQGRLIDRLESFVDEEVGLISVDAVNALYRVSLSEGADAFALNRELNRQMAVLARVAKDFNVAVLTTSQVHEVPTEDGYRMEPLSTRVLKFWASIILKMEMTGKPRVRKITLEKHPEIRGRRTRYLKLEDEGFRDVRL